MNTIRLTGQVARLPGALIGGILGTAVSIPIAGLVKLGALLYGDNAQPGMMEMVLGGTHMGALIVGTGTRFIGCLVGTMAGLGLSIAAGFVGFFGTGLRDAVTGDVHRLEREGLTIMQIVERIRANAEESIQGASTDRDELVRDEFNVIKCMAEAELKHVKKDHFEAQKRDFEENLKGYNLLLWSGFSFNSMALRHKTTAAKIQEDMKKFGYFYDPNQMMIVPRR